MHLKAFLNGIMIGAILGILFAPDSGEETRRKLSKRAAGIKDSYDDFTEDVSDSYHKVKNKAKGLVSTTKNEYEDLKGDASESIYNN